jgi:hypothetical protein
MMNSLIRSLLLTSLIIFSGKLISQDTFHEMDKVYGLDPLLYNGKKYSYFLPSGTGGNQFLASSAFVEGDMVIRGKGVKGVLLNYDIYNQKLLLQYADETGAFQIIEVSEAWLEHFSLGDMNFIYLAGNEQDRIYQALGDGPYRVLYYWRKSLKLSNSMGDGNYTFSPPVKTRYVLVNGELHPFRSKGSLIRIFDPAHKPAIKRYFHENGINPKKASDQAMTELINFIGNLE